MFYVGNLIWSLCQPSSFVWLLTAMGLLLMRWPRFVRLGRRSAAVGLALVLVLGLSPLGNWLILPLEQRFPVSDISRLGDVSGIIVLGGAEDGRISMARGQLTLNEAGERISEAVRLAHLVPGVPLIFTGGAGAIVREEIPGGEGVVAYWRDSGIEASRIKLEGRSITTYENAQFTRALLQPKAGQRWLLVTSAAHMPRAVGLFRKAGFDVIAHPVDYRTKGADDTIRPFSSVPRGLQRVDEATREWVSLIAHWMMGRTDALLPAP